MKKNRYKNSILNMELELSMHTKLDEVNSYRKGNPCEGHNFILIALSSVFLSLFEREFLVES
jgi:hypothetical protein